MTYPYNPYTAPSTTTGTYIWDQGISVQLTRIADALEKLYKVIKDDHDEYCDHE